MNIKVAFTLALTAAFTGIVGHHAEAATSKPDLIVSAVSAPSSASPGETIVVSGTIKNQGRASSNAFSVAAYLSVSPSNITGATLLGTQNVSSLAAGASVQLVGSLPIPGTTTNGTFYIVAVADSTNVINESNESNNTRASGAIAVRDVTPPTISAVNATGIAANNATIAWSTNEASTSQVEYGTTAAYGSATSLSTSLVTSHGAGLSSLVAGTLYHFRVRSKDAAGNEALSSDYTFTTVASTAGNTYYAATTGNDGNPGTETQPFRTLAHGVSMLSPGDTLYVMSGTYAEALIDSIPPGASWDRPVTVAAYPGHTVRLKPDTGAGWVLHFQGPQQFIVIDGLILDGTNVTYDAVKITAGGGAGVASHIRLIDCEIAYAPQNGVLVSEYSNSNELLDLHIHHNGGTSSQYHGVYVNKSSASILDHNLIHDNGGWGIHLYGESTSDVNSIVVRNNMVYKNGNASGSGGIVLGSGDGNTAYNNLVWGNGGGGNGPGIKVGYYSPSNTTVYNNTVYSNSEAGIYVRSDSVNTVVENNIFYANGLHEVQNYGIGSILDHNLVGTDPKFTNVTAGDFHLQAGSPAIDAGVPLSSVTMDIADTPRPQGITYDIGAYEMIL